MSKRTWIRWGLVIAGIFCVLGFVMIWGNWWAPSPVTGEGEKQILAPCPESPNCVCSCDSDEEHSIAPFELEPGDTAVMSRLQKILEKQPRARIVTKTDRYIHAEFVTPWLRFIDDVEFLFSPEEHVIHVRSASRVGYSDLGVNRKRIEAIRQSFQDSASRAEVSASP